VHEVALPLTDLLARRVPDLDVKSGARVTRWTAVEVHDLPHWAYVLLPLGPLSALLVRLTGRRGVRVDLPVTGVTLRRRGVAEVGGAMALVGGVGMVGAAPVQGSAALAVLGLVTAAGGALLVTVGLSLLWVRGRLVGDVVVLGGVHRAFAEGVRFLRALGLASPPAPPIRVRVGPRF
jgi:hypothetical protein